MASEWCERPTFRDDRLPVFDRPEVKRGDTNGKGVDRITAHAVIASGTACEEGFPDPLYPDRAVPFFRLLRKWRSETGRAGVILR